MSLTTPSPLRSCSLILKSVVLGLTIALSASAQTFRVDRAVPIGQFAALKTDREAAGYHLTSLKTRGELPTVTLTAIWQQGASTQAIFPALPISALAAQHGSLAVAGYELVSLDGSGSGSTANYCAVFEQTGAAPGSTQLSTELSPFQLNADITAKRASGFEIQLMALNGGGFGPSARYTLLYKQSSTQSELILGQSPTNLATELDTIEQNGDRVLDLSAGGTSSTPAVALLVERNVSASMRGVASRTKFAMGLEDAYQQAKGYEPTVIVERPDGEFSGVFSESTVTTPTFVATGRFRNRLSSMETVIQDFMEARGITHGAVAVTRNGRLKYARGFNNTVTGNDVAQPTSMFRLASVSKPITAVAILKLVDDGLITLDQNVNTILDLSNWSASAAQNITVRHLLSHQGGWDRTASQTNFPFGLDPMFIDNWLVSNQGASYPVSQQDIIDYMASRNNLDFTPGTRYAYSNFGYLLLGKIIEAVTGVDYETYVVQNVLGPAGAGRMRTSRSSFGEQVPGEDVPYIHPRTLTTTSVIDGTSTVTWPYGGWNLSNMDANGGWVGSVIDVARFVSAFDDPNNSPLLSATSVQDMWALPSTGGWGSNPGWYYGLGWVVQNGNTWTSGDTGQTRVLLPGEAWHDGSLNGTFALMFRRTDGVNWVAFFNQRSTDKLNPLSFDDYSLVVDLNLALDATATYPQGDEFPDYSSFGLFGQPCDSSAGPMAMNLDENSRPVPGGDVTLRVEGLPTSGNPTFVTAGISNTITLGGLPLPLDLTPFGFTGCSMYVGTDFTFSAGNTNGVAGLSFPLPNDPAVGAVDLFFQGLVLDPLANNGGIAFSAGAQVHTGL